MAGKFEDYTLGRNLEMDRVKEMYRLAQKHGLRLAGLRSFGRYITEEDIITKRRLADELRRRAGLPTISSADQQPVKLSDGVPFGAATRLLAAQES
ncbi:MAG: hypothetical protein KatS3mg057_2860 [Herpetosiphonaceae bacterium]|nr:MAG: hypothetical protein KatS3mg057_2860 [Herpetosiphonaceae bacterium]